MAQLNFPDSPQTNDTYVGDNGITYIFDGVKWVASVETNYNRLVNGNKQVVLNSDGTISLPDDTSLSGDTNVYLLSPNIGLFTPNTWISMEDGTIPGKVQVLTSRNENNYKWNFNEDGSLTVPGFISASTDFGVYSEVNGNSSGLYINASVEPGSPTILYGARDVVIRASNSALPFQDWTFKNDGSVLFPVLSVDLHNGGTQNGQVLQFGDPSYQAVITGPTPADGNTAQRIIIQGQRANGQGEGGDVYLWGGDSQVNGGDIKIYAGDADSNESGSGGYVNLSGGRGYNSGGDIQLEGGYSSNGQGGDVRIAGGGGLTSGVVRLSVASNSWTYDADGKLTLPNGNFIQSQSNTGELNIQIINTTDSFKIYTSASQGANLWEFTAGGKMLFPNGTAIGAYDSPNGIDIKAFAENDYVELNYDEDQFVWADRDNVYLGTNWKVDPKNWTFDKTGGMTFPDGTTQTTAWQGAVASDTAPTAPDGNLWFNSTEARMYVKYNEQWVDASPTVLDPTSIRPDQDGLINLPAGGQLGNAQRIHQNNLNGKPGVDLYASLNERWVQLNYNEDQYIWADKDRAYIETAWKTPGEEGKTWKFEKSGDMIFPDGTIQNTAYTGTGFVGGGGADTWLTAD